VIRKKRYLHYREPSSAVVIQKRRPAVAVEGVSTRSDTTRESGGAGVRERSSGGGNAGGQGGQGGQPTTSGRSGRGGASRNSGIGTGDAAGSR
jgi:hypothetical protein